MQANYRKKARVSAEQRFSQSGFTLVELLVTIVVGSIAIATIVSLYVTIQDNQRNVWYLDVATRAARSEIENARTKGMSLLTPGTTDITSNLPSTLPHDATGTTVIGPVFAGEARIVTVTITWQNNQKKVVLSGVVGRKGLIP